MRINKCTSLLYLFHFINRCINEYAFNLIFYLPSNGQTIVKLSLKKYCSENFQCLGKITLPLTLCSSDRTQVFCIHYYILYFCSIKQSLNHGKQNKTSIGIIMDITSFKKCVPLFVLERIFLIFLTVII